jgi:hypothetical protein
MLFVGLKSLPSTHKRPLGIAINYRRDVMNCIYNTVVVPANLTLRVKMVIFTLTFKKWNQKGFLFHILNSDITNNNFHQQLKKNRKILVRFVKELFY